MNARSELVMALDDLKDAKNTILENWELDDREFTAQELLRALTLVRLAEVKIETAMKELPPGDGSGPTEISQLAGALSSKARHQ